MKTQTNIGKSKKWAILFVVLMAVSAMISAQPAEKGRYDKELVSMVELAWNDLDQLAVTTENNIRYEAPAVPDEPNDGQAVKSEAGKNSSVPVWLVESSRERKDELNSNPRSGNDLIQVAYYQDSRHTMWYKIRNIVTNKPAVKCNVCTRVVSTPYVVYMKPGAK
jgi:hypothetical protein